MSSSRLLGLNVLPSLTLTRLLLDRLRVLLRLPSPLIVRVHRNLQEVRQPRVPDLPACRDGVVRHRDLSSNDVASFVVRSRTGSSGAVLTAVLVVSAGVGSFLVVLKTATGSELLGGKTVVVVVGGRSTVGFGGRLLVLHRSADDLVSISVSGE